MSGSRCSHASAASRWVPHRAWARKRGQNAIDVSQLPNGAAWVRTASPHLSRGPQLRPGGCTTKVAVFAAFGDSGEPFELSLQAWLGLLFLPTYKGLLKQKAKGLLKRTI